MRTIVTNVIIARTRLLKAFLAKHSQGTPHSSKVLREVRRDSLEDFLCAKHFPDFLPKLFVDFLSVLRRFYKLFNGDSIFLIHKTRRLMWFLLSSNRCQT